MKTKSQKIATAGKTIDGRELTEAQIQSAADTYATDAYTARLNLGHVIDIGGGHIESIEAHKDERGRLALYAVLEITSVAQRLHEANIFKNYSVELVKDFPNKGDWYLAGLAMTDNPASQGLPPQTFSAEQVEQVEHFNTGCQIDLDPHSAKQPFLKRVFTPKKQPTQGRSMDTEQFETLSAAVSKTTEAVVKLTATLTPPPEAKAAAGMEDASQATALADQTEQKIEGLTSQVAALTKQLQGMEAQFATHKATPLVDAGGDASTRQDCI